MRKRLLLGWLFIFLLSACQQDDIEPAAGQRPDERLNKVLTDYKAQLVGAPYGWKAILATGAGPKYSFLLKFAENDRVNMFADIRSNTAGTPYESSYRLKALQQPALLFDTYSPLHILADPDPRVYSGEVGQGLYSDFEFTVDTVDENSIQLTGNLQRSKMVLVKATKEEFDAYNAGQLKTVIDETAAYTEANPFIYLPAANGLKLQVGIDDFNKIFSLTYLENGNVQIITAPFTYTPRGLLFDPPLNLGSTSIRELFWDSAKQVFYAEINGARVEVQSSPTVIIPLHYFVGVTFAAIGVPPQPLPGWSEAFTSKHSQAAAAILQGRYRLTLGDMYFAFDTQNQAMQLFVVIYQDNNQFVAVYPYNYTKTPSGVYKFSAGTPNGNGQAIAADLSPILDHIGKDNFTLDYYNDPTQGALGQVKSVQDPDFYFTGTLEK